MATAITPSVISAAALVGESAVQLRRLAAAESDPVRYRQLLEKAAHLQHLVADIERLEASK